MSGGGILAKSALIDVIVTQWRVDRSELASKPDGLTWDVVTQLDECGIYGVDIIRLYRKCGRNAEDFVMLVRSCCYGLTSRDELVKYATEPDRGQLIDLTDKRRRMGSAFPYFQSRETVSDE